MGATAGLAQETLDKMASCLINELKSCSKIKTFGNQYTTFMWILNLPDLSVLTCTSSEMFCDRAGIRGYLWRTKLRRADRELKGLHCLSCGRLWKCLTVPLVPRSNLQKIFNSKPFYPAVLRILLLMDTSLLGEWGWQQKDSWDLRYSAVSPV